MWPFNSIPSIPAAEAADKLRESKTILVDVRTPQEFAGGHAKDAYNCPLSTLDKCVDKLKDFSEVYVICQSGGRSASAVSKLLSANIKAINVEGGTIAWRALGLPLAH
jgi:rhodanese-related sulfurtransferase